MTLAPLGLLVVLVFFCAFLLLPIYAAIKAFNNSDNGWGIGILIGMFVPFGFILAIVYLVQQNSRTSY